MGNLHFSNHGSHSLSRHECILVIHASGPWNLESALYFDREVRDKVTKNFHGKNWGMLVVLSGQGIYTPESTPVLEKLHLWRIDNGLRHIAIVHSQESGSGSVLTESQFNSIYRADEGRTCESRYFRSPDDAMNWLMLLGYAESPLASLMARM